MSSVSVASERRRQASAFNAKRAFKMQRRKGINVFARRAGTVSAKRRRYRSVRYGHGILAQQCLSVWRKKKYKPRRRLIAHDKAMAALDLGMKRATWFKQRLVLAEKQASMNAWFEDIGEAYKDDAPLMDICMSGHVTLPEKMAWLERYEHPLVDWDAFDDGWMYNRSIQRYVKQPVPRTGKTRFGSGHKTDMTVYQGLC